MCIGFNELIVMFLSVGCAALALAAVRLGAQALVTLCVLYAVFMNVFVCKQILLFGWESSAADALSMGAALSINLLREFHGAQQARQAIWLSAAGGFCCSGVASLILLMTPSPSDLAHPALLQIWSATPRILVASIGSFLLCEFLEVRAYGWLQRRWHSHPWVGRHLLCTGGSQILDTLLFTVIGLYGVVSPLLEIGCVSLVIKFFVLVSTGPLLLLSRWILPSEGYVSLRNSASV
ncbi:MAG: queuosine precursor transporter [Chlamydiia bacterium]